MGGILWLHLSWWSVCSAQPQTVGHGQKMETNSRGERHRLWWSAKHLSGYGGCWRLRFEAPEIVDGDAEIWDIPIWDGDVSLLICGPCCLWSDIRIDGWKGLGTRRIDEVHFEFVFLTNSCQNVHEILQICYCLPSSELIDDNDLGHCLWNTHEQLSWPSY